MVREVACHPVQRDVKMISTKPYLSRSDRHFRVIGFKRAKLTAFVTVVVNATIYLGEIVYGLVLLMSKRHP